MKQPFYEAANAVIKMYALRQERLSAQYQAHSPSEIDWAVDRLTDLALAAAYSGSKESVAINELAIFWKDNKQLRKTPSFLPVGDMVVAA